jgi:hypothetical protein
MFWSSFKQSNNKIQKAGVEELGNAHMRSPASDLERQPDNARYRYG